MEGKKENCSSAGSKKQHCFSPGHPIPVFSFSGRNRSRITGTSAMLKATIIPGEGTMDFPKRDQQEKNCSHGALPFPPDTYLQIP